MRNVRALGGSLCVVAALLVVGSAGPAQEKGDNKAAENVLAWGLGIRVSAAMQTFALPSPISVAALRVIAGRDDRVAPLLFPEWEMVLDAPIPLRQELLDLQQDDTPIPNK